MNNKQGKVQYQFKSTKESKEKNFVLKYTSFFGMLKCLYKAYKTKPDNIFIFTDPSNYR